jgi:hypothetical protein
MKKLICIYFGIFLLFAQSLYAKSSYTYEKEITAIEVLLSSFNKGEGKIHNCTKDEVELLLREGAKYELNLFEILYIANTYLTKVGLRISMKGFFLRELEDRIAYGNERVYNLMPISILEEVQVGPATRDGEHILDIFFSKPYEKYIEIGTAIYDPHIGFTKISDNTFSGCFGMTVKKFGIKKKVDRIFMYEKKKIAIYVKAFPIPKKWVLENVYVK